MTWLAINETNIKLLQSMESGLVNFEKFVSSIVFDTFT